MFQTVGELERRDLLDAAQLAEVEELLIWFGDELAAPDWRLGWYS